MQDERKDETATWGITGVGAGASPADAAAPTPTTPAAASTGREGDEDVRALLGFLNWSVDDVRDVTDAEADYVLRQVRAVPLDPAQIAQVRDGVMRRRFPERAPAAVPHTTAPHATAGAAAGHAGAPRPADGAGAGPRPSIARRCRELKRQLVDVARELRLDAQTVFTLEQGHARNVPRALVEGAAALLGMSPEAVARCVAPTRDGLAPLAAHGRPGAGHAEHAVLDFLAIVDASRLSDEDKRYWHQVAADEVAAAEAAPDGPGA